MGWKLYHGAAYYPELWDEETIKQDIMMMKDIGFNVVRIGEFIWSRLEPAKDMIDTEFLKTIVDRLYQNGIEVIIGTPTATPPVWMSDGHPERMHVDAEGRTMIHGARQHICTNNPYMRQRSGIIVEQIAKTLHNHPGVAGWQIDNELKCHVHECYCSSCNELWHEWLEKRYGSIKHLNRQWGTPIWSELYQSFDQVPQPRKAPFLHNPSLTTAYRLFTMEKIAEFVDEQAAIIRRYSNAPITHNGSFGFLVDNEWLYRNLDEAAFDSYAEAKNYPGFLMCLDFWKNVKKGKSFWVMETSTSHNGSSEGWNVIHPRGYLVAEAVTAYAMGSKSFIYWLWRQQRTGCEMTHGAVLSAWGKPTVGYMEVLEVEKARRNLEPILFDTEACQAELGIVYSDRAKAFLLSEPHLGLDYRGLMQAFYTSVAETGIDRDLILEGSPLDGYKILLTPYLPSITEAFLTKAKLFVERGGIWIAGPLAGGRTTEHTVPTDVALGGLEKISGVETLYTYPMDGSGAVGKAFGQEAPLTGWSAVFQCQEAEMIGTIQGGPTPGLAFITEHRLGKGRIVLLGSEPSGEAGKELLKALIRHYAVKSGITKRSDVTAGTIVIRRTRRDGEVWIIVNMDGKGGCVTIPTDGRQLPDGCVIQPGPLGIERYGYRIVALSPAI